MNRFLAAITLCALVAACSTPQVQSTCERAERILQIASPFLSAAPASVQLAATALSVGTHACGTPEYAAAREHVVGWLASRGIRAQ